MAGPARVQWGGRILDTDSGAGNEIEIWSCSTAFFLSGAATDAGVLAQFSSLLQTWHGASNTGIHPTVVLDYVKVNTLDADGHYVNDPTIVDDLATPIRGGGTSSIRHPVTTAARISLSNATRNRRAKGGWFVPRPAWEVLSNGRWRSSDMTAFVGTTQTFFGGINDIEGVAFGVLSRPAGPETEFFVSDRWRLGDVPDNIRRRKNNLDEVYILNGVPGT